MDLKTKKSTTVFLLLFLTISILFLVKSFISSEISLEDEMHYIATALRFCNGDAYLVDDWSPEQLNSILLLPFVYIFKFIFQSTDGIVIYFRFLYLLFKIIVTVYALYRLKTSSKLTNYTLIGVSFYYFFTPYNIETLSYNTIPLSFIFLIIIILLTYTNHFKDYYFCGILLALSALSQPFLAILYFFSVIACCSNKIYSRIAATNQTSIFSFKNFFIFTTGIITVALLFLLFIFSRARFDEVLNNIIYIFSEPDHNMSSNIFITLLDKILLVFRSFFYFCNGKITFFNAICLVIVYFGKRQNNITLPFILSTICLFISCFCILISNNAFIINAIYIPFVWFSIEILFMIKKNQSLYVLIMSICFIYVISTSLGTNTGILSTSAAMCIFSTFSLILVNELSTSIFSFSKAMNIISTGVFIGILLLTLVMRLCIVWTDIYNMEDYTYLINDGPLKGTLTNEDVYVQYTTIIEDLDSINCHDSDILFCGTSTPTAYIYLDVEFGTMGTPFFYLDYNRLETYFTLHPNKFPTIIYYENLSYTDEERYFLNSIKSTYQITQMGNRLIAVKNTGF